jgi:hypothetical protein
MGGQASKSKKVAFNDLRDQVLEWNDAELKVNIDAFQRSLLDRSVQPPGQEYQINYIDLGDEGKNPQTPS